MTSGIQRRISEHKSDLIDGFSKRYKTHKLVYFEEYKHPTEAIAREKQLKGYKRDKKLKLINGLNPEWKDLSEDWYC
jgi:putative endonuclease